ncbi:MAG: hypothetical protein JW394_0310 [Nitrospira sp.]|nr:hypothetical protein [Nitrospira sp.]
MEVRKPQLENNLLGFFIHELVDIDLDLLDDLLDSRRMDTPVMHQPFERHLGDLSAQGIEARDHDGFRRFINDQIDSGCGLDRADIAPFPSDDPPLHRVVRNLDDGNRRLGDIVAHHPLNRGGNDLARFPLCIFPCLFQDPLGQPDRFQPRLTFHFMDELLLRLVGGHPRDALQRLTMLLLRSRAGRFLDRQLLFPLHQIQVPFLKIAIPLVDYADPFFSGLVAQQ